jgi:hypothetical protein
MPQRFVIVPADVQVALVDQEGKERSIPFTFKDFIKHILDTNPIWGKSYKNIRSAMAIETALILKVAGEVGTLAQEDWDLLKEAIEKPQMAGPGGQIEGFGYLPQVVRQLVGFMDAVVSASDKEPTVS